LRTYARELWDFVSELEEIDSYSDSSFVGGLSDSAATARDDAYHYFHEFSPEERALLSYPIGSDDLPHRAIDRCADAASVIEKNLTPKSKRSRRSKSKA
jgi:hypothetical protein